jgi:hypothetical protein
LYISTVTLDLLLSIGTHEYPQALSSPPSKPSSSFPEKGRKNNKELTKNNLEEEC